VPGSPYMTFVYAAATPVFTPTSYGVTAINGVPLAQVTFPRKILDTVRVN